MNYNNLYVNLLLKHGTEVKPADGYYELHHIIPKSMGGGNEKDNLIYLSGRAHFIAHWLLYKIHDNKQMARAFFGMCDIERKSERKGTFKAIHYEIAKKAFSKHNHMKLQEHKDRASISAKVQWSENYEQMKESNAFMFKDPAHPMYMKNKTGDLHPRSKAVITPLGRFGSVRDAGKAHKICHNVISRRCKSENYPDFYYESDAPSECIQR
jgi:hypothetical protein